VIRNIDSAAVKHSWHLMEKENGEDALFV